MLAVAGGKGGCGKTTTALGLGRALDGETVVVDTDRDMPNLHAMAGVDREPMAAPGAEPQRVDDGLSVLPAPSPTTRDAAVTTILDGVANRTDARVVVDCPGGAGPDAAAPLAAATRVVLVSTACAPALRDATKTGAMARALGCHVEGVVLTRTRVTPPGVEALFDCPVLGTVPDAPGPVLDANPVQAAYADVVEALESDTLQTQTMRQKRP
ncbi:CDP-4-keto-6-deoxy-D-glucose-3-dehydrase [Salinigranum rubrum]|uniref:CDP-4-keto-6-deoxy-D-glucose-3-dehydrase n=1 Tax=Salinigranum rubrum TaxID=755307 RepID=A0A2I8VJ68_9EURY|nr:P-loop NTPase [Salinigranum rubrum]AUV81968.1 CDP-4-keto-6-deoxy-D-glucose-3-dehydrase [Salinigranum rubrum]